MSGDLHSSLIKDTSHFDNFFSQFSCAFLNFAAEHYLRVDKYWHGFPSWRFSFQHPKGGAACIQVFMEGEKQLSIFGYWWMDDYDQGRRRGRKYQSDTLTVDAIKMADLLEVTLITIVGWPLDSWTDVNTELGDSWKKSFTKEQFEFEVDNYPHLKPYSFEDVRVSSPHFATG
jgi:hypothetical protein